MGPGLNPRIVQPQAPSGIRTGGGHVAIWNMHPTFVFILYVHAQRKVRRAAWTVTNTLFWGSGYTGNHSEKHEMQRQFVKAL
jgi:hypothetical protein